jgi:hypothetical protein
VFCASVTPAPQHAGNASSGDRLVSAFPPGRHVIVIDEIALAVSFPFYKE